MCVARPFSWAASATASSASMGQTAPPPMLVVFSTETRRERWVWGEPSRSAERTCAAVKMPRSPGRVCSVTPAKAAGPPAS